MLTLFLVAAAIGLSQSGRKGQVVKPPTPVEEAPPANNSNSTKPAASASVIAKQHEDYRCATDGAPARVLEPEDSESGEVFTPKTVDVKAFISKRPKAGYTHEARRAGVQGNVILRVILLSTGELGTIRVLRGLPGGLTENAIRAACKLRFRPAIKNGKEVSQSVQIEYTFRIADPIIME